MKKFKLKLEMFLKKYLALNLTVMVFCLDVISQIVKGSLTQRDLVLSVLIYVFAFPIVFLIVRFIKKKTGNTIVESTNSKVGFLERKLTNILKRKSVYIKTMLFFRAIVKYIIGFYTVIFSMFFMLILIVSNSLNLENMFYIFGISFFAAFISNFLLNLFSKNNRKNLLEGFDSRIKLAKSISDKEFSKRIKEFI